MVSLKYFFYYYIFDIIVMYWFSKMIELFVDKDECWEVDGLCEGGEC